MILMMSRENTIKKLLSSEMYNIYIKMAQSGISMENYKEGDIVGSERKSLKNIVQNVAVIAALIMKRALKYTPIDTGALRKSIYIKNIGTGVVIGYSIYYAIYVHEIGFYYHESPTRYKFLEEAAFEVALETNTPYRISISYDPLEVYVNIPNKGVNLVDIKRKENENRLISSKNKVWEDFINYDSSEATEDERVYYEKMARFFYYWRKKNYDDWWILDEWQVRNRHD